MYIKPKYFLWIRLLAWLAVALFVGFIFWNSAQNGTRSGSRSAAAAAFLQRLFSWLGIAHFPTEHFLRKTAHFLEYFSLGILFSAAMRLHTSRWFLQIGCPAFFSLLIAVFDEFFQTFIPGRSGQVSDVLLDFCGALTGVLLFWILFFCLRNRLRTH